MTSKLHPKYGFPLRSFWDSFESPYQMGPQKHRTYMLDLLAEYGVESLLDVGAGTGPVYELIVQRHQPIIYKGTDYSPAMIEIAKELFPEGNWEVEDARDLDEIDNTWDCVLLMHALDHLDNYQAAIAEAARVAKRYVCIILWRPFTAEGTNLNDRNMMNKKDGEEPWEDTHLQEYSKEALETEFQKNLLKIVHIAEGEAINSDASHYNFLYLLEKQGDLPRTKGASLKSLFFGKKGHL